jgi:putative redox protein
MSTITAELTQGTQVRLSNGRHNWSADEPLDAGGADSAPTPYELLLGALAACTCITVSLYCRHKGIALKAVSARYELTKQHAKDCEDCDKDDKGFIERITSHVRVSGTFDDAQRTRLEQIVSRCPVHKTLAKGVTFADNVQFGA